MIHQTPKQPNQPNKPHKSNWLSNVKVAIAGLLLSGTICLEATDRLHKGTAIAISPVVVTIVNGGKKSSDQGEQ